MLRVLAHVGWRPGLTRRGNLMNQRDNLPSLRHKSNAVFQALHSSWMTKLKHRGSFTLRRFVIGSKLITISRILSVYPQGGQPTAILDASSHELQGQEGAQFHLSS